MPQDVLDDLHDRLRRIRWPVVISGQNYGGPELANMKDLAKKAAELNRLPHFKTAIDVLTIHFIHVNSREAKAAPLMLIHGSKIARNTEKISCQ